MSQVITHQIDHKPQFFEPIVPTIIVRNKSPLHQKQTLIQKIELLTHSNDKLEVKQQSLQNTIYDLRKIIQLTRKQGDQAVQHLHSEIVKLETKKESVECGLKYAQRDGNHLQRCMLFWNEFL